MNESQHKSQRTTINVSDDAGIGFHQMNEKWYQDTIRMVRIGYKRFCERRGIAPTHFKDQMEQDIKTAQNERTNAQES